MLFTLMSQLLPWLIARCIKYSLSIQLLLLTSAFSFARSSSICSQLQHLLVALAFARSSSIRSQQHLFIALAFARSSSIILQLQHMLVALAFGRSSSTCQQLQHLIVAIHLLVALVAFAHGSSIGPSYSYCLLQSLRQTEDQNLSQRDNQNAITYGAKYKAKATERNKSQVQQLVTLTSSSSYCVKITCIFISELQGAITQQRILA